MRPSFGLARRVLFILLLTVTAEFFISTLLYERASQFSLREDEAHRLAEHLVIARKLVAERPPRERAMMASLLTTDRYVVRWAPSLPPPTILAPELGEMRQQILAWEPSLANANLRLRLKSPGLRSVVMGGLTLPDGSWIHFGTRDVVSGWDLALGRVLLALVPAIALVIIGSLLIRQTLKPVRMLAEAAERYGYGDRVILPEIGSGDMLRVIKAFNGMQDRIQGLISDRTRALAAAGHDLRTPLARLRLRIEMIGDGPTRGAMERDAIEMERMLTALLTYLGGDESDEPVTRVDVAVMMATIADTAADEGQRVRYEGPESLEANVRPYELKRAVGNLLSNAIRHSRSVVLTAAQDGERLILQVNDDGPGIPPDRLADVVQPFVRIGNARENGGLGLGLAIVERIARSHHGDLRLSNRSAGGLSAEINLPIVGPRA